MNDDGNVLSGDLTYLANFFFLSGPSPLEPYPSCGPDPTDDSLTCGSHPCQAEYAAPGATLRKMGEKKRKR